MPTSPTSAKSMLNAICVTGVSRPVSASRWRLWTSQIAVFLGWFPPAREQNATVSTQASARLRDGRTRVLDPSVMTRIITRGS
jgi:hypothetical protein